MRQNKLDEVIRGLIGTGFQGTQTGIVDSLIRAGFHVTQSTVSRRLKKLGVVKEHINGKMVYRLSSFKPKPNTERSFAQLFRSIHHNGATIVIKTHPGSAMFMAGFIDRNLSDVVLGTVAGDDTIFVAPKDRTAINSLVATIKKYFQVEHL